MHASELEEVLSTGLKDLTKDQRKLTHLLRRVVISLRARTEDIQQLQREIAQMRQQSEQVGRSSSLNPLDQVRYLSKEQIATLFGRMEQERLAAMERETRKAADTVRAAGAAVGRVRYELLAVIEDPVTPAPVKDRLRMTLAAIEPVGPGSAGSESAGSWSSPAMSSDHLTGEGS